MKDFVHLHLHTEFSLLDGAATIDKVVELAKSRNMPAIAMTDHGNMFGAVKFFDACKKHKIKAIIGCEFYVAEDLYQKAGRTKLAHLVLLAKDKTGYDNLCKLNSIAWEKGFYGKPRIDYKTLENHYQGLVCLSACIAGDIPQLILKRQYEEAEQLTLWFKNLFKDDFYLEIQNHFMTEQIECNEKLIEFAKKHDIKLVATNDVHYINRDDAEVHDVLLCVNMGKTQNDPNRMKFPNDEFYFKSYEEMAELFPNNLDALDNTLEVAEKCNFGFVYGQYMFPKYQPITGQQPLEYLTDLVMQGVEKKYKKQTPEIMERINYEINLIQKLGFIEYFLIVWDYINAARSKDIAVGPGRGSGVGSIVAYTMGITNVDPLKYGLFFERFLNPERVSAPDFDIDFEDSRRSEVFDYVKEKYGEEKVAKIITFGTMAAKNAIKDVARVLSVPYADVDKVTKAIPGHIKRPIIKKAFGLSEDKSQAVPELVQMYTENSDIKRVIDIAYKLEDNPRQTGIHACGVIIGGDILDKHIPLAKNGDDVTTQFVGVELEHLGLLKMDFLGLRNLSDIKECVRMVKKNHGVEIDFDKMEYDNAEVYKLISTGNTKGIFQIESVGFQKFMRELQPTCLEDIIAAVSLYRPGPMDSIPTFVKNKHNPDEIVYVNEKMERLLDVTYGCIVYQEQVMKIVQDIAGYSLGAADNIRRLMSKKKYLELAQEREVFLFGREEKEGQKAIVGAIKNGMAEKDASELWAAMEKFGSYAFNKSHAAAYAHITYQTAYLKTFYKPEFLTSVLNNRITNADEIKNYVAYAKEEKIQVLPPDINHSDTYFTVKDGIIRFGLAALKNVGIGAVDSIIKERNENGPFKDLFDFLNRVDTMCHNKRLLESMIFSGAFDCFNIKRSQLSRIYIKYVEIIGGIRKRQASGQITMFGDFSEDQAFVNIPLPDIDEFDNQTKLKLEKEVVGLYISGHPLQNFTEKLKHFSLNSQMLKVEDEVEMSDDEDDLMAATQKEPSHLKDGMIVTCGGIISDVNKMVSKKTNKEFASAKLEDLYGSIELIAFNNAYYNVRDVLVEDKMVTVKGKLSLRDGQNPSVMIESVTEWTDNAEDVKVEKKKNLTLYLKYDLTNESLHNKILKTLKSFKGSYPVRVKCEKRNSTFELNVHVDGSNALLNELHAYIPNEYIKLL